MADRHGSELFGALTSDNQIAKFYLLAATARVASGKQSNGQFVLAKREPTGNDCRSEPGPLIVAIDDPERRRSRLPIDQHLDHPGRSAFDKSQSDDSSLEICFKRCPRSITDHEQGGRVWVVADRSGISTLIRVIRRR